MYNIIRFYRDSVQRRRFVKRVPTLALAQEHCKNPETSSRTCTNANGKRRTRRCGPWFEGYEEVK